VAEISTGTNAGTSSPAFSWPSRASRRRVNNWLADAPCRDRYQPRSAIALHHNPIFFCRGPTAPRPRRDNFKPRNPRHRHMVSHTPISSLLTQQRKAAHAGAILCSLR
jgi:hypothetical protein